jgi:SpoVK/Ycf46/Vps4 family AAA+-type ATPase
MSGNNNNDNNKSNNKSNKYRPKYRNKRSKSTAFKSHTDVNNYNNFLLDLDKKHKENASSKTTISASDSSSNSASKFKREHIKIFMKDTDNNFKRLGHDEISFSGINPWETLINAIQKHLEPNSYEPVKSTTENDDVKEPICKTKINIVAEINNIGDLLTLIETYPDDKNVEYNINMNTLHKIKDPLIELNNMIGMKDLKENIVDQIIFYIQNLHTLKSDIKGNDFMHTVIYGPPGTGKTEIAKIIGAIFSKMGILTKGTFKKVTRSDLIAGYLGQTALKTRDVVKECLGGVLFIDEAYSLGNEEKRDSFSKECIDTLCEALSDHKDNLMVIIAGYETDLDNCFFTYNQGLNSRFTWRFKTDQYTAEDLYNIFLKKVKDGQWCIAEDSKITVKWFEKNKSHFKFYGRDIETLFAKTKIAHSRRVFCLDPSIKKMLTIKDIDKGLTIFLKNEDSKEKEKDKINKLISSMYV